MIKLTDSRIQFANSAKLYKNPGAGLPCLIAETAKFRAVICLQGAHLLEFKALGKNDLLWLSKTTVFDEGNSLRGGIPICAPWFAGHLTDKSKPSHGFVRNRLWELSTAKIIDEDCVLKFTYESTEDDLTLFPFSFKMTLEMILNEGVQMNFSVENTSSDSFDFSWALHSYFDVKNAESANVSGLAGEHYLDKVQEFKECVLEDKIHFTSEVDRVFQHIVTEQTILPENIHISGENCPTVIVWNPAAETAKKLADVGDAYVEYICVERGAAAGDIWTLPAGNIKSASMYLRY